MQNTIEFKGPFNINHLDKDLEQKLKNPGIYIWGFMVDSNYDPLNCKNKQAFDSEKMHFLPYYVGKKESQIFDRLNEHKNVRTLKKDANKYTRLSMQYLKTFFNDPDFPIKTSNSDITKEFIEIDKSDKKKKENGKQIEYYNNSKFLDYKIDASSIDKTKINKVEHTDNPITNFSTLNDTLEEIIINKNNFWFCYGIVKNEDSLFSCYLENFETLTFYSLKGKTISKTGNFNNLLEELLMIDKTDISIFKEKTISKKIITEKYLNENNEVKFPGY